VHIEVAGIGRLVVEDGREVTATPALSRQARAIALVQRGFAVLHASAVLIEDEVVAFVGDCGAGKSTVAAALCSRGHGLVADDVVGIDVSTLELVEPIAEPLRLRTDVLSTLDIDSAGLRPVEWDKRELPLPSTTSAGLRLATVYVLADAEEVYIETLDRQGALFELARNSPAQTLARFAGSAAGWSALVATARRVTVRRLARPRDLTKLADLAVAIEQDCLSVRALA
jgi:hypothetical protein